MIRARSMSEGSFAPSLTLRALIVFADYRASSVASWMKSFPG
jgi:hypothetical protein